MRALVTGSAGFLGRHFVHHMKQAGWCVSRYDPHTWGDALNLFTTDQPAWDLVVHCAARSPHRVAIDSQPASLIYNQLLDAAMFEWAVRTSQRQVLYISSCAVLDEQPDDYGLLKLAGERMARQARDAGVSVTVVRPFSGYGEDQGTDWPFGAFTARARRRVDPFPIWGDGQQIRDWIHVVDVVAGALAVAADGTTDPVSLCTGVGTSMVDLVRALCAEAGYDPELELHLNRSVGQPYRVGDPTRMNQIYRPRVSLAEGVKRAMADGALVTSDKE